MRKHIHTHAMNSYLITVPLDLNFTYARVQNLLHVTFMGMLPSSSLMLMSNSLMLSSSSRVFSSACITIAHELLVMSKLLASYSTLVERKMPASNILLRANCLRATGN